MWAKLEPVTFACKHLFIRLSTAGECVDNPVRKPPMTQVVTSFADPPTPAIGDDRVWAAVQEAAAQAMVEHTKVAPSRTTHICIDGAEYWVRAELRILGASLPVMLVAVEGCARPLFPLEQQLRHTFRLTPAEIRVAFLLAERKSNREIMTELNVGKHTARRHTEKVLSKMNIHQRTDVRVALRRLAQT